MSRPAQKLVRLDPETDFVLEIFNSVREASEKYDITDSVIRKGMWKYGGRLVKRNLKFRYFKEGDVVVLATNKKINQIDIETGEVIETYNSIIDAAEDNYLSFEAVSVALRKRNGEIRSKGLKFEYA